MEIKENSDDRYWLSINGASVAACPSPCPNVEAHPTPQLLLGLKSREEQLELQEFLLTAPTVERDAYCFGELAEKIEAGEIREVVPENSEPPTQKETTWSLKK